MWITMYKKRSIRASKFFVIGLVLHFFAHTLITFGFGRESTVRNIIRAWKELWIAGAAGSIIRLSWQHKDELKARRQALPIKNIVRATGIGIVVAWLIGLTLTPSSLTEYLMAMRYDYTGFVIFIISFIGWRWFLREQDRDLPVWISKVLKTMLIAALIRRWVIFFLPRLLEFAGYNSGTFEGEVGMAPPTTYYTDVNQWYPRNQFLFERPTSRGFFLIAFWPLFFVTSIRKRNKREAMMRFGIFGLNVLATFSRAAWLWWLIQTTIIVIIDNRKMLGKAFLYYLLPWILVLWAVTYVGRDQILNRSFSNLWHIQHTLKAVEMVANAPIVGQGPGKAGPVTHHGDNPTAYNPENQFLTIWIQYGIIGFGIWMYIYLWMMRIGVKAFDTMEEKKLTKENRKRARSVFALSLWLFGLSIEGMFLHSFIDRMIVYPFMLVMGLTFAIYYKTTFVHDKDNIEIH